MPQPETQDAKTFFNQGFQQLQAGNYEAALTSFKNALALDPNNPKTWEQRGIALQNLGRYVEAIAALKPRILTSKTVLQSSA